MIQKPLLWVEVGKSACVLVGICGLRLSLEGLEEEGEANKAYLRRQSELW
jgi:hypothetical protein